MSQVKNKGDKGVWSLCLSRLAENWEGRGKARIFREGLTAHHGNGVGKDECSCAGQGAVSGPGCVDECRSPAAVNQAPQAVQGGMLSAHPGACRCATTRRTATAIGAGAHPTVRPQDPLSAAASTTHGRPVGAPWFSWVQQQLLRPHKL